MNQKELNELRRRWKPDKNAISRIYGCFVNSNKEIITDLDESLGMMTQEEAEKYLSLLKKALSGALGKNLIDIVFSTQQVMTGEEHRMLMELRTSGAKDARVRQAFYQKVIQSLDMGESNYLLLLANDSYDVPHRNHDALRAEGSDEVFSYILCAVCPVKTGKTELGYFSGDNEFHSRRSWAFCSQPLITAAPTSTMRFFTPAKRENCIRSLSTQCSIPICPCRPQNSGRPLRPLFPSRWAAPAVLRSCRQSTVSLPQ